MDEEATTQPGAADQESQFQQLYDTGAFDPNGKTPEDASAQTAREEGTQSESTAAGPEQGSQAEAQESTYSSLDDLLTSLKVDPTSARSLPVTVKIDGQEKQVPLQDVLKSYQLEGHVNNKSIELSNRLTQFEAEQQAARTFVQQQIQQNQALGNLAMQMLTQEYQRVDWNTLRLQNPAEFAALQTEFQQRQGAIAGYLQQVQVQQQQQAQIQQQQTAQWAAQERQKLMESLPEWKDPEAFGKDREQMVKYARSIGFQDGELNQIFDHRYMRVLHDAARYQALQAAKPDMLKQVREAPRMVKPGSRVDTNPTEARRQAAIERFNRNPRDEDAQAAVFEFLA